MSKAAPFNPSYGNGLNIPTSTTSTSQAISKGNHSICVTNTSATGEIIYFRVTKEESTATTADQIILAGEQRIFKISVQAEFISAVSASGTPVLHVITGEDGV